MDERRDPFLRKFFEGIYEKCTTASSKDSVSRLLSDLLEVREISNLSLLAGFSRFPRMITGEVQEDHIEGIRQEFAALEDSVDKDYVLLKPQVGFIGERKIQYLNPNWCGCGKLLKRLSITHVTSCLVWKQPVRREFLVLPRLRGVYFDMKTHKCYYYTKLLWLAQNAVPPKWTDYDSIYSYCVENILSKSDLTLEEETCVIVLCAIWISEFGMVNVFPMHPGRRLTHCGIHPSRLSRLDLIDLLERCSVLSKGKQSYQLNHLSCLDPSLDQQEICNLLQNNFSQPWPETAGDEERDEDNSHFPRAALPSVNATVSTEVKNRLTLESKGKYYENTQTFEFAPNERCVRQKNWLYSEELEDLQEISLNGVNRQNKFLREIERRDKNILFLKDNEPMKKTATKDKKDAAARIDQNVEEPVIRHSKYGLRLGVTSHDCDKSHLKNENKKSGEPTKKRTVKRKANHQSISPKYRSSRNRKSINYTETCCSSESPSYDSTSNVEMMDDNGSLSDDDSYPHHTMNPMNMDTEGSGKEVNEEASGLNVVNSISNGDYADSLVIDDHNCMGDQLEAVNNFCAMPDVSLACSEGAESVNEQSSACLLLRIGQYPKRENKPFSFSVDNSSFEIPTIFENNSGNYAIEIRETKKCPISTDDLFKSEDDCPRRLHIANENLTTSALTMKSKYETKIAELEEELRKKNELNMNKLFIVKEEAESQISGTYRPIDSRVFGLLRQLEVERKKTNQLENMLTDKEKEIENFQSKIINNLESERETAMKLEACKHREESLAKRLSDVESKLKKCKMGRRIQREEKAKRKRARAEEQRSRDIERMGFVLTSDSSSSDSDSDVEPSKNVEMMDDYVKVNPPINKSETMKGSIDATDLKFHFKILDSMDVTDESKEFINKIEMNSFGKLDEVKDARKERQNMDASNRNMKSNLQAADVASEYARQLEVESNTNGEFHEEMRKHLECECGRSNDLEADFRRREGELVKKLTDAESELKKCKKILDLREKQEKLKLEEELEEEKVRRIQQEAERAIEKSRQAKVERLRKMEMLKNELSVIY